MVFSFRAPLWPQKSRARDWNFQARMKISNREWKFQARMKISCVGEWFFHAFEREWFFSIFGPSGKGAPKRARISLSAEPLKSLEKRGKTYKKSKENRKTKKARKTTKARIFGGSLTQGGAENGFREWSGERGESAVFCENLRFELGHLRSVPLSVPWILPKEIKNLLMPLFLMGCFPVDFQEVKRPLRTKSAKRPIKVGKRPINEGKRPIKAKVLVGVSVGCLMGCFRAPLPWRKTAPLKRPIKRSMRKAQNASHAMDREWGAVDLLRHVPPDGNYFSDLLWTRLWRLPEFGAETFSVPLSRIFSFFLQFWGFKGDFKTRAKPSASFKPTRICTAPFE